MIGIGFLLFLFLVSINGIEFNTITKNDINYINDVCHAIRPIELGVHTFEYKGIVGWLTYGAFRAHCVDRDTLEFSGYDHLTDCSEGNAQFSIRLRQNEMDKMVVTFYDTTIEAINNLGIQFNCNPENKNKRLPVPVIVGIIIGILAVIIISTGILIYYRKKKLQNQILAGVEQTVVLGPNEFKTIEPKWLESQPAATKNDPSEIIDVELPKILTKENVGENNSQHATTSTNEPIMTQTNGVQTSQGTLQGTAVNFTPKSPSVTQCEGQ